jgi:hypothetical protein
LVVSRRKATVTTSDATTNFGASKIIAVDQDQRTITFKTKEGETWTSPVTDPAFLKQNSPRTIKSEVPTAPRVEREDR